MPKFLEYNLNNGHIISEIISEVPPTPADGFALLQVDDNLNIDTSSYAVRDAQLVKLFETNSERAERERLRKEYHEQVRKRLHSLIHQCMIAFLDDNSQEINNLRFEFKKLKAYL